MVKLFGSKMPLTGIFIFLCLGIIIGSTMCVCRPKTWEGMALLTSRMGDGVENSYDEPSDTIQEPPYETHDGPVMPCSAKSKSYYFENSFHPRCCAFSNISSNGGCACITKEQIDCLANRGGNNTGSSNI